MDIVIVAQYIRNIECFTDNNSRFVYLAKLLTKNTENRVEIIASDFAHITKKHVSKVGDMPRIKVTALHESGYHRNVCLKRFASHRELAKNVSDYLSSRKKPDVCYCAFPSLDVAEAVAQYCSKHSVRFIVDVQDLWPEAFKMVFNIPILSDLIFAPMNRQANRIFELADDIVAVSKTYAERAMRVNKKCKSPTVVYLGTEKESFDRYAQQRIQPDIIDRNTVYGQLVCELTSNVDDVVRIAYCGTLGHSYDITCVLDALRKLNVEDQQRISFIVMGDGPRMEEFVHASEGLPVVFTGRLSYPEMVWILSRCDVAVNPIVRSSAASIINKHMDYAMGGLPVINTQMSIEYRELLYEYNAGINCECENVEDVKKAIKILMDDKNLRKQMGMNSLKMGTELFDRKVAYQSICNLF